MVLAQCIIFSIFGRGDHRSWIHAVARFCDRGTIESVSLKFVCFFGSR